MAREDGLGLVYQGREDTGAAQIFKSTPYIQQQQQQQQLDNQTEQIRLRNKMFDKRLEDDKHRIEAAKIKYGEGIMDNITKIDFSWDTPTRIQYIEERKNLLSEASEMMRDMQSGKDPDVFSIANPRGLALKQKMEDLTYKAQMHNYHKAEYLKQYSDYLQDKQVNAQTGKSRAFTDGSIAELQKFHDAKPEERTEMLKRGLLVYNEPPFDPFAIAKKIGKQETTKGYDSPAGGTTKTTVGPTEIQVANVFTGEQGKKDYEKGVELGYWSTPKEAVAWMRGQAGGKSATKTVVKAPKEEDYDTKYKSGYFNRDEVNRDLGKPAEGEKVTVYHGSPTAGLTEITPGQVSRDQIDIPRPDAVYVAFDEETAKQRGKNIYQTEVSKADLIPDEDAVFGIHGRLDVLNCGGIAPFPG